jgi:uncharacterized protein (TIGR02145 family)
MKKSITFLSLLIFACINLPAQNFEISFAGTGTSTTVETVEIQNLTQGINLTMNGTDILNLVGTVGIEQTAANYDEVLRIYPNPTSAHSTIEFELNQTGLVTVELFDITGKKHTSIQNLLPAGIHTYNVSGLSRGIYTISITSNTISYSGKIISNNHSSEKTSLIYVNSTANIDKTNLKSSKEIIQMQYNNGDLLLFRGVSSNYVTVVTLRPTSSTTVTFNFVSATDGNGNNYGTVTIGTQTWMTENLRYVYANSAVYPNAGVEYGRLYDFVEAQSVCPSGWHLPSDAEWTTLTTFLGGASIAGRKLKETGTTHWLSPSAGTNEVGFSALPGGGYINYLGNFSLIGEYGMWWSSTGVTEPGFTNNGYIRNILHGSNYCNRTLNFKGDKLSVRCIKD